MKCPVMSFMVYMGLVWLWADCLLMLRTVFLLCWRISMVCLALEVVGSLVVLGFNVVMEAFDEVFLINVPWSQEFSGVLRFWT